MRIRRDALLGFVDSLLLSFIATQVLAQDNPPDLPNLSTVTELPGATTTTTGDDDNTAKATSTDTRNTRPTETKATDTKETAKATSTQTDDDEDSSSTVPPTAPTVTGPALSTTTQGPIFRITNAPTIAGAGIPTMVVPFTANAPFMQKSNLPEGTVFICVGAALGFLGMAVLAWRGLVAWSLHRSVKKAAMQTTSEKTMLRAPGAGFYSSAPAGSTMSLDQLTNSHAARPFSSVAPTTKTKHASNLFFSPTAGAGLHSSTNRSSGYLPAGYYATGNAAPAGGNPMTHIGGGLSNLNPLGPAAAGYQRAHSLGTSPPNSPGLPPKSRGGDSVYSRGGESSYSQLPRSDNGFRASSTGAVVGNQGAGLYSQPSTSTLNLGAGMTQGRAPSAYLEDLFENHGNGPRERF